MNNKDLENRILKVGMWIFTFFFWYLVIAFFLKSDYPIYNQPFNRKDAYEVLRDALTLSAYFLAPAMAYVLFSDWRTMHIRTTNERLSIEILEVFNDLGQIREYGYNSFSDNPQLIKDWDIKLKNGFTAINIKLSNINSIDDQVINFKDSAYELKNNLYSLYQKIKIASFKHTELKVIKDEQKRKEKFNEMDLQGALVTSEMIKFSVDLSSLKPLLV